MKTILTNSKARHEYHIEETYEAGIVLTGTEVKSLRAGKGQIRDAFARDIHYGKHAVGSPLPAESVKGVP